MSAGPLKGVTVVEFGGFIARPFAGQLLGDYGARAFKAEPPGGDPMRRRGVPRGPKPWWSAIVRDKEPVVLGLKTGRDHGPACSLMVGADVVPVSFPGKDDRVGLSGRLCGRATVG